MRLVPIERRYEKEIRLFLVSPFRFRILFHIAFLSPFNLYDLCILHDDLLPAILSLDSIRLSHLFPWRTTRLTFRIMFFFWLS